MSTHPFRRYRNHPVPVLLLVASVLLAGACARQEGTGTVTVSNVIPGGETVRFTNISIEFSKAVVGLDSLNVAVAAGIALFQAVAKLRETP